MSVHNHLTVISKCPHTADTDGIILIQPLSTKQTYQNKYQQTRKSTKIQMVYKKKCQVELQNISQIRLK